ncbi:MAG: MFS transporter [Promethearchaeota archaeon]
MSETKISSRNAVLIFLMGLAGNIAWAVENQYYNVFMYNVLTPEPIYVSIMVALTAIVQALVAILIGAYSDVKGKRRPFLLIGFICWTITTAIFPTAAFLHPLMLAIAFAIIYDCIMTFFGAMAFESTYGAYVVDITTVHNRGKALGIMQLTMAISTLLVYGISGFIIQAYGYFFFFYFVGVLVGIFGITGAVMAREPQNLKPIDISVIEHLKSTFRRENISENKDCFLVLTGAFFWTLGFNIFFPFILIYLQHYMGYPLEVASIIVLVAFIISISAAYPIGVYIDKIGRKKVAIISIILDSFGLLLFAISGTIVMVIIAAVVTQLFMASWNVSAQTWIKDLYPEEKYGQFSGYFVLFTLLFSMPAGSLIGGWLSTEYGIPTVIDGKPGFIPTPIIFIVAAIIMLLAIIPLFPAKEKLVKELSM